MKLLERLRATTTSHHENLHIHPALSRLTDDSVSRSYVVEALQKFYGFYAPMERRYTSAMGAENATHVAHNELLREFPAGAITMRLRHDLNRAGVDADDLNTLDEPSDAFTLEQTLAYLYLREGSNLGGKIISRKLKENLSLEPGVDNQFFWGHGADAGRNWQAFLQKLSELENQVNVDTTADYAAYLFEKLGLWLNQKVNTHASTAT